MQPTLPSEGGDQVIDSDEGEEPERFDAEEEDFSEAAVDRALENAVSRPRIMDSSLTAYSKRPLPPRASKW